MCVVKMCQAWEADCGVADSCGRACKRAGFIVYMWLLPHNHVAQSFHISRMHDISSEQHDQLGRAGLGSLEGRKRHEA